MKDKALDLLAKLIDYAWIKCTGASFFGGQGIIIDGEMSEREMLEMSLNGCTCHMIQSPGQPYLQCISCRGREQKAAEGKRCRQCKTGVHTYSGDSHYMDGLCTACYYGE